MGNEDVFFNPYVRLYGSNDIVARFGAVGLLGKQITGEGQRILLVSARTGSFWINAEENIEKIWHCVAKYTLVSSQASPRWSK